MATLEALAAQLQALQGELQQQHNRIQVVEAENAQLRANSLGALPQLIQVLQTQTQQRLQQLFMTVRCPSGQYEHTLMFKDPLLLERKTMRHLMGCALTCPGMKLIARTTGIRVFHVVCDRAMTASFVNALSGYVSDGTEDPLCVWHTAAGYSAHDIHNSVRWISGCVFQNDKLVLHGQCVHRLGMPAERVLPRCARPYAVVT
eukprot:1727265-Amphidinium_carterae.1